MNIHEHHWITDRMPTEKDASGDLVCVTICGEVLITHYLNVSENQPWMPIVLPEPYVKPQRYGVRENYPGSGKFVVYDTEDGLSCSSYLPTREAAERIAAIYEEVMP